MASFKVKSLDHVQLAMPSGKEEDARKFYAGTLGIPEVEKPMALRGGGGVWFENGALKVHLGVERDFRAARKAHPAFMVFGLAALEEELIAAGYEVRRAKPLNGVSRFHAFDPFGNRLEFIEADH